MAIKKVEEITTQWKLDKGTRGLIVLSMGTLREPVGAGTAWSSAELLLQCQLSARVV